MTFGDNFFKDLFSTNLSTHCSWVPANQFLFQLANIFLVFTYFVKPNGIAGLLQLRVSLTMAGLCFGIWGGMVICSFDCMVWNLAFAVGNGLHLAYLCLKLRPKTYESDHEKIFNKIFKPVGIKRFQYDELLKIVNESEYQCGDYYAQQQLTDSDHIGIVVKGCFSIILEGKPINYVQNFEFLDSPEWLYMSDDHPTKYQVSLVANETSKVFKWQRNQLIKIFKKDGIIKNVFDLLIGKDICKKLYSLHQTFLIQETHEISNQLKKASLLSYSAGNIDTNFQTKPSHLPTATYIPMPSNGKAYQPIEQLSSPQKQYFLHQNAEVGLQQKSPSQHHQYPTLFNDNNKHSTTLNHDNDQNQTTLDLQKQLMNLQTETCPTQENDSLSLLSSCSVTETQKFLNSSYLKSADFHHSLLNDDSTSYLEILSPKSDINENETPKHAKTSKQAEYKQPLLRETDL